ncbi:Hypothetical_protein [Hexamita inflata]|uniref:Hypothetical_protein n=1 Tax=Hexamita inflata TaxID=28002 RepID=A0AA86R7H8_9EUKA|nr:Hypothetical protein HINF_LOCUS56899 [Hexamita inflata]CAI9972030.1 Hypothetical protein HINF_LOCUS59675 [Hexamita inflata]
MPRLMEAKTMNTIIMICVKTLALSAIINWFVYGSLWIDSFFRMLFLVICCILLGIAPFPWAPAFVETHFNFLLRPIWKSGFMILLACFFFPCFSTGCWKGWSLVFQNVCALTVFGLGLVEFVLEIIDCKNGRTTYADLPQ